MKNVMLVFPYNVSNNEEFYDIINEFDKREYDIHIFDEMENSRLNIDELPEIVSKLKKQYEAINKIVVLSNAKELIFTWYRCYNSLVDDYIYFIDDKEQVILKETDRISKFIKNIANFNNIKQEYIEGKIYLNIKVENYKNIYGFLMRNRFMYFDNIVNIDYFYKDQKRRITKVYEFLGDVLSFELDEIIDKEQIVYIKEGDKDGTIEINDAYLNYLGVNTYFIPYFVLEMIGHNAFFSNYFKGLFEKMNSGVTERIFNTIYELTNSKATPFFTKLRVFSFICFVKYVSNQLIESAMKSIMEDDMYIEYHYDLYIQIICWRGQLGFPIYPQYYQDTRNVLKRLAAIAEKDIKIVKNGINIQNKRIAVVVDQLLSLAHSPTKVMLDYAMHLKKYYPEYEIKIFVEDDLYCSKVSTKMPCRFSSIKSESCKEKHLKAIEGYNIEIYYVDSNKDKKAQVKDIVNEIFAFNPGKIFTNSYESVSNIILYSYFPIVYLSMGDEYFSNYADRYLCLNKDEVVLSNKKYNLLDDEDFVQYNYGLSMEKVSKKIERKDLNLNTADFVMITVGNRLDVEMDAEFIDCVCAFIKGKSNVKWLIVGAKENLYLREKYGTLLDSQIYKINFCNELSALYNSCDVYLNPRRHGGGISIAMAMNQGLPIVILSEESDGIAYVGKENASGDTFNQYIEELNHLYLDEQYKKEKSEKMLNRIELFKFKEALANLMKEFKNAEQGYLRRKNSAGDEVV